MSESRSDNQASNGDTGHPAPGLHDDTLMILAGLPQAAQSHPFLPGPTFAAPYHLIGDTIADAPYIYNRQGNPTWSAFEDALGELEHGYAVLFSSGMAAVVATLLKKLKPGDSLLVPSDSYSLVRVFTEMHLVPRGVELRTAPTASPELRAAVEGATLVWLESLSNPGLEACDLGDLIGFAHACGAEVIVDNSFVAPIGQRPLDLDADFTVASASKYISGHSDLMLGYVVCKDEGTATEFRKWRALTGAVAGPFETWLAHRSLATLGVRYRAQCANALAVATFLVSRGVRNVRYPGLAEDPAHPMASRYLDGFGSVLNFELTSAEAAQQFLAKSRLIHEATSFGGVHTTGERTARWGYDAVPGGFIRLAIGCEDSRDLIADLDQALLA